MAKNTYIKLNPSAAGGRTLRIGINGIISDIPIGVPYEAQEAEIALLRESGIGFEEVDAPEGAASKEGSVDVAPAGTPPAMIPQSPEGEYGVAPNGTPGDQPGNVTPAGEAGGEAGRPDFDVNARVADTRVAAERRTTGNESPAELAGEGEQGTPKAKPTTARRGK